MLELLQQMALDMLLFLWVILETAMIPYHTTIVTMFALLRELALDLVLLKKLIHFWTTTPSSQHIQEDPSQIK